MSATFHSLRVAAIDELTDDAVALTFASRRRWPPSSPSRPASTSIDPRRRRRTPLLLDLHVAVLRACCGSA